MKKKIILVLIFITTLVLITGCSNDLNGKANNNIGFKSSFIQEKTANIEKYPNVKSKMQELEERMIDNKVNIKKIEFSETTNQLIFFFYFNDGNDKMSYYFSKNNVQNNFYFYTCRTMIYQLDTFEAIKYVLMYNFDFSESEINSIKEVSEKGDYVRFRSYLVDYEEESDIFGIQKQLRIIDES